MDEQIESDPIREYLDGAFHRMALHMRNQA